MIRVIADANIPYLKGVLEPYADVLYVPGNKIDRSLAKGADALLVRTRTNCDSSLLEGTPVRFIASATIGTDHIDLKYLASRNIAFANAPGCNAGGVMQYVHTALIALAEKKGISLEGKCLGVIGVGNTGSRVAALAEHLGMKVLRNDPPKMALAPDKEIYCSLEHLLENSDIITMHVPLDESTIRMGNSRFFSKIKPGAIFINASRGEVLSDEELLEQRGKLAGLILDVWNGEPNEISRELVDAADIATPHIAGYSLEGKVNGTKMVVQAFARHFGIEDLFNYAPEVTPGPRIDFGNREGLSARLLEIFPIYELDCALRFNPAEFEKIRSEYKYRREFVWE